MATPFLNALLAMSPVACWPLNDAGGTAIDVVNGYNGTYYGADSQKQASILPNGEGNSFKITPSGAGYILVPSNAALKISATGSLLIWFKGGPGVVSYVNPMIDKAEEDYVTGYAIHLNAGDARLIVGGLTNTDGDYHVSSHFMVGRWDYGGTNKNAVWIDGMNVTETGITGPAPTSDLDLRIGLGRGAPTGNADVTLQYATVFNRALTNSEIAALWAASSAPSLSHSFFPSFRQT